MKPSRIVILGGTGFVGHALVERLTADGHKVTVLSRNSATHLDRQLPPGADIRDCDVYSTDALALALRTANAHVAINLVGILNESGRWGRGFRRAHVELTQALVAACQQVGTTRLLQMSALNAGRGRSHYLATRGEAEALVKASTLEWTIFQPSVIFGPGDGFFCRFAGLLKLVPVLPLARAGAKFAPVFVGDVVDAFARALRDPATVNQTYELYGPDVYTLKQIVQMTARRLGLQRTIIALPDVLGRLQGMLFDFVPGKPFSSDNFRSLQTDSVGGIDGLHRLGIQPTPVAVELPDILGHADARQGRLDRYRARF